MAFNFNWAPLSGDPDFYKRAEELLTSAMNKNSKPPIIVDDIIVTELNLGEIPPDLEVVEISDIGVDKFRGTFKMSYTGNAYITIKTRVQANPMNTYLVTRPAYTTPKPLAAAAGLTIPLQITLSDFKLSAIIILVFSRQKGLTIVFRNDPLESLKVSSTFDSIPFVANYLQQVIEGQLRTLFMDELPAIIHRMSLRLWVPEHRAQEERALAADDVAQDEVPVNPLASPPQDPVDATGTSLSPADVAALALDSHLETQSLFSRKNLLRLATLTDSHRTLSLFTPNIRDAVFRAWTGPLERREMTPSGSRSATSTPALSRAHSYSGSIGSVYTFDSALTSRQSLHSLSSTATTSTLGGHRLKSHSNRKRKKRVVNLRKQPETGDLETVVEDGSTITDSTSVTSESPSVFSAPAATSAPDTYVTRTPSTSPRLARLQEHKSSSMLAEHSSAYVEQPESPTHGARDGTARRRHRRVINLHPSSPDETPRASRYLPPDSTQYTDPVAASNQSSVLHDPPKEAPPTMQIPIPLSTTVHSSSSSEKRPTTSSNTSSSEHLLSSSPSLPNFLSFITDPSTNANSTIAERAWMMKMAAEVSRRYEEERQKGNFDLPSSPRDDDPRPPPPAYAR